MAESIASGTMVGEFEIVKQIGEGGMGEVYLAIHPIIGKRAAVKVLRDNFAKDKELVHRFVAEARAVNSIEHPNIIDVFAFGQLADGRQFYIMEYLDGLSLEEHLQERGRLPLSELIAIFWQIAEAVDAAHERGVIHRDLKPENIFLVPRRSGGHRIVILDFGIAKLSSEPANTSSGLVLGTPHYMSPEQCMGMELDARSDQYALAIICYRALCGRLPFDGGFVEEVMYQQTAAMPEKPSEHGAPRAVDEALLKALDKDPEERFVTVRDFVSSLAESESLVQPRPGLSSESTEKNQDWNRGRSSIQVESWHDETEQVVAPFAKPHGKKKNSKRQAGGTTACMNAASNIRLQGHSQIVQKVAYCPAGGILASTGDDQTVRLWSYDGKELAVLKGHRDKVGALCFSPHGHLLASGGSDGRIMLWSVYGGDCMREFLGHRGRVNSLTFSPDGENLLSGGNDGSVRLWSIGTGNCQVMSGHTSPVRSVAYSPTGRSIASAGDDKTVRIWRDGQGQRKTLEGHQRTVYSVVFSPDGQFVASGGHDGSVIEWSVKDGKAKFREGHTGIVWHVQYSPDGTTLASSSSDGVVRLWRDDRPPQVLEGHGRRVRESIFSPNGSLIATVGVDGTIRLWESATGRCKSILSHSGPARSVSFAPNGDWVATSGSRMSLVMTPISESEIATAKAKW